YDHKNDLQPKLSSRNTSRHSFPSLQFFRPRIVCYIDTNLTTLTIESTGDNPADVYHAIIQSRSPKEPLPNIQFSQRVDKQQYLDTIQRLRDHIAAGDCYEINYCTEGYSEGTDIQPLQVFKELNAISPAPFAAYYRQLDQYMMCA